MYVMWLSVSSLYRLITNTVSIVLTYHSSYIYRRTMSTALLITWEWYTYWCHLTKPTCDQQLLTRGTEGSRVAWTPGVSQRRDGLWSPSRRARASMGTSDSRRCSDNSKKLRLSLRILTALLVYPYVHTLRNFIYPYDIRCRWILTNYLTPVIMKS